MGVPKWLQSLANATIRASIADSPAVATASGYRINSKTGEVTQDATDDPGVKQLRDNLAVLGGTATGITAAPVVGAVVSNPVAQKLIGDAAASMLGGEVVDKTHRALTGQSFGRGVANIFGQQNVYDGSALARFGYDALNPGYFAGNLVAKGTNAAIDAAGSALKNADNYITIQNALRTGKLRFGEPTNYIGWHQSMEPIKHFEFPYNRWDVREHNADPNGVFFTLGSPVNSGFLGKRRFSLQFEIPSQKPLIQTGEVRGLLGKKNNTRNAIVKYAKKHGADAVEFRDIADNTLKHQDVLFMTDKINPELKKTINNRFVVREKLGPSYRLTLRDVREPNLDIGYLDLIQSNEHNMFIPAYIENYTKDFKVPYKRISEDLYDAAIKTASENKMPFVSGTVLESPEATTRIWRQYANNGKLKVLDNNGLHGNVPRQERVVLTEPLYDTRIIDFDKQGGKIKSIF